MDEIEDDLLVALLTASYVRRKKWEARVLASALMGGGDGQIETDNQGRPYRRTSAESLLKNMGAI